MNASLVIIPGLGDSGEEHWQTYWLKKYIGSVKVNQDDWDVPILKHWLIRLNETIIKIDKPVILVAHSLAVSLVIHWASKYINKNVAGALLVAPADVDSPESTPDIVRNFSPIPLERINFPTIIVASSTDQYCTVKRARFFADNWGSDFVDVGPLGHINAASDLRYWEEGQLILQKLLNKTNL